MRLSFPQFPNSVTDPFHLTSPNTPHYNCIAWAYGEDSRWFWPDPQRIYYWPEEIQRDETLSSFIQLFESIGYVSCDSGELEELFEKISIYIDSNGKPTHAARQLHNGYWTSKLGASFDITHTILSMSDGSYGNIAVFMKRQKELVFKEK